MQQTLRTNLRSRIGLAALGVVALLGLEVVAPYAAQAQESALVQESTQADVDLDSLRAPFELRSGNISASYKIYLGGFHIARLNFFISETHSAQNTTGGFHYRMSGQTTGWAERLAKRSFLAVSEANFRREEAGVAVSNIFYWSQFRALENTEAESTEANTETENTETENTEANKASADSASQVGETASGFLAHEALRPRYFLRNPDGKISTLGGAARWAGTQKHIPYGANNGTELTNTVDLLAFFARFFKTTENTATENNSNQNLNQQCQANNEIYDGKYFYRITFDSAERKMLNLKKFTPYKGEFTLCRFTIKPLGGFRNEQRRKSFPTSAEFWLHKDPGGFSVPVLFTFRTRFGLFLGYLQDAKRIP